MAISISSYHKHDIKYNAIVTFININRFVCPSQFTDKTNISLKHILDTRKRRGGNMQTVKVLKCSPDSVLQSVCSCQTNTANCKPITPSFSHSGIILDQ